MFSYNDIVVYVLYVYKYNAGEPINLGIIKIMLLCRW